MSFRPLYFFLAICTVTGLHCQADQSESTELSEDQRPAQSQTEVAYDTSRVVPPPLARKSPIVIARTLLEKDDKNAYIKVVYGSPSKRGRVVFGALEPFGEVWRVGANETTEITTSSAITFGDVSLEAGTYSLFAIPEPTRWTVIVNSGLGQWGAYDFDESLDVGRFVVSPERTTKIYEAFTMWFDQVDSGSTKLHLAWDETQVSIPVTIQ